MSFCQELFLQEKDSLRNLKIKPLILKYIGVGIPTRSVMAEETTNNLLNFDIEVNLWAHLKTNSNLNLYWCS